MALAPGLAEVGNLGQYIDQRTELWYHETLLLRRVLAHVGGCEFPTWTKPFSVLGFSMQPQLQKLNDPGYNTTPDQISWSDSQAKGDLKGGVQLGHLLYQKA